MANDVLLASLALIGLWLGDLQVLPLPGMGYGILRLTLLVLAFGLAWQLNVYLRTDLYYLIANFTGCRNLAGDAASYLQAKLSWLLSGTTAEPQAGIPERERLIVKGFAAVMAAGTVAVVALGAACLGGLAQLARQPAPRALWPLLASLGLTGCWLVWATIARHRGRPRLSYHLLAPEDL